MSVSAARRRPRKLIVLALSPEQFDRLERQADAAERIPEQQARWLLLRALDAEADGPDIDDDDRASAARG